MGAAENIVQSQILEYLGRVPGVLVAGRMNNNAVYDKTRKIYRSFSKYAIRGFPDITALALPKTFPQGTVAYIEAKDLYGATSEEQYTFLCKAAKAGQTAILARSWHDVRQVLEGKVDPELGTGIYIPTGVWGLSAAKRLKVSTELEEAPWA